MFQRITTISALVLCALFPFSSNALQPKEPKTPLDQKEFFKPELYISVSNVPLDNILTQLPNRPEWVDFIARGGGKQSFIDPRSGAPSGIISHVPLIPGKGAGNNLSVADLQQQLGRNVAAVDSNSVRDAVLNWVRTNQGVLRINPAEFRETKAARDVEHLWQAQILRQHHGIPVRHSRFMATISHGNLVLAGVQSWGPIALNTQPNISGERALEIGFNYAGGRQQQDFIWKKPALEIVPVASNGESFKGPVGEGYGHRLVWVFGFQRRPEIARWEVMVDAHSGEMLSFQDLNQYAKRKISGGVYPLTNTEACATTRQCGTMQLGYPMPFADTGLPAPNNFTNSAGVYDFNAAVATTTLSGLYVNMNDECGPISESSTTGDLNLGGSNGQHDCETAGSSPGNTPSSRSGFYELNKLIELARGWLPENTWLDQQITANMNIIDVCNANYDLVDGTINFFRSGSSGTTQCANTGEIAAVFDHEWGHALDDNDSIGVLSNSSEGYADIVGILRLQSSCVGHGFFLAPPAPCGLASDGTRNVDEDQTEGLHCAVDCSGVRDSDWALHEDKTPDTPINFVCGKCAIDRGPCGRQVHCSAAPVRQAGWDLAARDLQSPPFNYDSNTAFLIANKIFYQGSGNVALWYTCECTTSQSNGCNADSGYLQWLAADDDNGLLLDGTPHMTAIFNAYNRHGIACSAPAPVNSGCAGAPAVAPNVTATSGDHQVQLTWNSIPGATKYWVFRTEGFAGCDFGKAKIAEVTGTQYTDTEVANVRTYSYSVMAVGNSNSCFGPASSCATTAPQGCGATLLIDKTEYGCNDVVKITVSDDRVGAGSIQASVRSQAETTPETVTLTENPPNSGIFTGSISTTGNRARRDGRISVNNTDQITVQYTEPNQCGQANVPLTATAIVSCNTCEGSSAPGPNLQVLATPSTVNTLSGDGDQFVDNCEQAELAFSVQNTGKGQLKNLRITNVVSSHSGVQITTPLPKQIRSRLGQCATAQSSFNFTAQSVSPGEEIEFRVDVTSDELAAKGITRSGLFRVGPTEKDLESHASRTFSFEADREGWQTVSGTFERSSLEGGANGSQFAFASSSLLPDQCDRVQSPVVQLTNNSTLQMFTRFDTEPCGAECYDRANVGIVEVDSGNRTTVDPDSGSPYNASGANGVCVTASQNGWAGAQGAFLVSGWSPSALQASSFAGKNVQLDVTYGTDQLVTGTGFRFDEVTLTNFLLQIDDGQSNTCP